MIIATAGHVDHGKTSLVKALTGTDADRLPEEKRRGMTLDLGFAYLPDADGRTLGFIDVPGHERFVHNMLAGVAGIDGALLVIAADDGPMPQTREHLAILDLLGVGLGAVALTKVDTVDPLRVAEVSAEIRRLLLPTVLADAPVFAVSSLSGAGLPPLQAHLLGLRAVADRSAGVGKGGVFRMTVDRAFTLTGVGLVVTGTVISGRVAVGDRVDALLAGVSARVRGLHAQSREVSAAGAGERCALNLAGADIAHARIARGDWMVGPGAAPATMRIDLDLRVLPSEARPLRHWTPVHAHIGAADVTGRIAWLETGAVAAGEHGLAQLVLDQPVGAGHGDTVIVRDQSARRTLGGGAVIDVFAPLRGRARPARLACLRALARPDPAHALAGALEASPHGLDLSRFAACRSLDPDGLRALAVDGGMQIAGPGTGFWPAHWERAQQAALAVVAAWHARLPDSPGVPEDRLLEGSRLALSATARVALAESLLSAGRLQRSGAALHLPGHRVGLVEADQVLWERVRAMLEGAGNRPPSIAEISAAVEQPARRIKDVLARLARQQQLWRVAEERFALPATVQAWSRHAGALAGVDGKSRFSAAQFRDRAGVGRNLAIEILEFFDRVKLTRRLGEVRMLQQFPHALFGADDPHRRL